MLEDRIMEKLIYFSNEEIDSLNGKNNIDKTIYVNEYSQIIDYQKLLVDNKEVRVRKHPRFCYYPLHRHNYIELIYVYAGKMTQFIGEKSITLNEGELMLLNQGIWHSIDYCNENDIIFNFIIKPEFFEFMFSMSEEKNAIFHFIYNILYSYQNNAEYIIFRTQPDNDIKKQVDLIITCLYKERECHLELKLQMGLLLAKLMDYPEMMDIYSVNDRNCTLMNKIMIYIRNNYQTASLDEISNKLKLPNYTISKKIKSMSGLTFKQLLQEERLKVAKSFLENTDSSINLIMEKIGYENKTYFYKIFKERYTMTPHEYRKFINCNKSYH
jgi:AraC-like DNA-binding protein